MPDTKLPGVTMAEEDLAAKLFGTGSDRDPPTPGWSCPKSDVIAAYLDGVLDDASRARLESHEANCSHCRTVLGHVVRMQREAPLPAPPALVAKAISMVPTTSRRPRWILAPIAAAGAVACTVFAAWLLRAPENLVLRPTRSGAVPIIAKAESLPEVSKHETARKLSSAQLLPRVITPRADSVVSDRNMDFRWKAVPHAGYYQVQVVTFVGEPVWEGRSTDTNLRPPSDLILKDGKYFVWILAVMESGRVEKSDPVGFRIASSR